MNRIKLFGWVLIACMALGCVTGHAETSLLVLGHSWHFGSGSEGMNADNYGIGVEYGNGSWFGGALTYRDSFRETAYAAYGGYRYAFTSMGWHGITPVVAVRAGYIHGSGFNGPMVLPTIGLQYKRVAIEAMFIPKVNARTVNVIGVFARINF